MATKEQWADIWKFIKLTFFEKRPPVGTMEAYYNLLKDIDGEMLALAVSNYIATKTAYGFPKPDAIRKEYVEIVKRHSGIPSVSDAWDEVQSAPANGVVMWSEDIDGKGHIYTKNFEFSHPIVEKVARSMGWPHRFPTGFYNVASDRAKFWEAYEAQLDSSTAEALSLPAVREYVESRQLEGGAAMKQLVERMSK